MGPTHPSVLLFGDLTDAWADGMDYVFAQAKTSPWIQSFLEDFFAAFKTEVAGMESFLQESVGAASSFQRLAEMYRSSPDQVGMVHAILLYILRSILLLQATKRNPLLLRPREDGRPDTHLIGISAGLWNAVAIPVATDIASLYDSCIEAGLMWLRALRVIFSRSRALEDRSGIWGKTVSGARADQLKKMLEEVQHSMGIPFPKRAKVGFAGERVHTVIGPPSVLQYIFTQSPELKKLNNRDLAGIRGLQHTLKVTSDELAYIMSDCSLLSQKLNPGLRIWGITSDDATTTYASWGDLIKASVQQTLSECLNIVKIMVDLDSCLGSSAKHIDIKRMGPSAQASYILGILKSSRHVTIEDDLKASLSDSERVREGAVAIVGMAGKGPESENIDDFWNVIMTGQKCYSEVPADRVDLHNQQADKKERQTDAARHGYFIRHPGHFDAKFFDIAPREALFMDPAHRYFLMTAYEALEVAGYSAGKTKRTDSNKTAIFYAQSFDDWLKFNHRTLSCDANTLQSIQRAFGPGRLASQMKWKGPIYALDSACAGSTSAIHLACTSLLSKDVDMAVAGATTILSDPHSFTFLDHTGNLSETGDCKPSHDDAGHCTCADFSGAIVLKRLEDAVAHNDRILAVIAASDGKCSDDNTSTSTLDSHAQVDSFKTTLRKAHLDPSDISYIEMHGTGTQVGDKAEMEAVSKVFLPRYDHSPLPMGSIKANIGHSGAAAGMSSLLKAAFMLQRGVIPPQAGMPQVVDPDLLSFLGDQKGIIIPAKASAFEQPIGKPKRILINNYDAAGSMANIVVEEYLENAASAARHRELDARSCHVITTSGRTHAAHIANMRQLVAWLRRKPKTRIQDIAYTTTARRLQYPMRFAFSASSVEDAISKLETEIQHNTSPPKQQPAPVIAFSYTGQGTQYAGMGSELYRTAPIFRKMVNLCKTIGAYHNFPPFVEVITNPNMGVATMSPTQTQLAMVTLEIALTAFWQFYAGIEPTIVMGHSLGEYAALHTAGVLSLTDTIYLVGRRASLLLEKCKPDQCAMLSVSAPATVVQDHLSKLQGTTCAVACINSPSATVVSGAADDLESLQRSLTAHDGKLRAKMLPMPFAFHSFQMDAILSEYEAIAGEVTYHTPRIPVASTLLASIVNEAGVFNAEYLTRQTRQAVDFCGSVGAVKTYLKDAEPFWIEVGPGPVCSSFVKSTLSSSPPSHINHTIDTKNTNWTSVCKTLNAAYMTGIDIDWLALHRPYETNLQLLTLPTYAWDVKDYWIKNADKKKNALALAALSGLKRRSS